MEDKFDKIWDALENAKREEIDPDFLDKMESSAFDFLQKSRRFSLKSIVGIAASLLLLISVNAYVLTENSHSVAAETQEISNEDYRLMPNPLI